MRNFFYIIIIFLIGFLFLLEKPCVVYGDSWNSGDLETGTFNGNPGGPLNEIYSYTIPSDVNNISQIQVDVNVSALANNRGTDITLEVWTNSGSSNLNQIDTTKTPTGNGTYSFISSNSSVLNDLSSGATNYIDVVTQNVDQGGICSSDDDIKWDAVTVYLTYTASSFLTVDIVDSSGNSVSTPVVNMSAINFSFNNQTATGTFGVSSEKIRVENTTPNSQWSLTLAASSSTSFWDGTEADYDFNDPTSNAEDGTDSDSLGGQMTINPSVGTITAKSGCTNTDLTLGSSVSFNEGNTDSITLITAGSSSETNCYWHLTGINISQTIPAEQPVGNDYTIDMVLTVTAI